MQLRITATRAACLKALEGHPCGLKAAAVGEAAGMPYKRARDCMGGLLKWGLVARVGTGSLTRWCLPQYASRARAHVDSLGTPQQQADRYAKRMKIRRRVRRAVEAPRLRANAANSSVWAWAAAA
jgi:DNA-binding IclR family transcriptional regulator